MTDTDPTDDLTPQQGQEAPESPEQAEGDQQDTDNSGPGREAARYRRRLRDTEAERDTLAEQVTTLQRASVAQHLTRYGMKADLFWASGVELADVLAEDGTPDPDALGVYLAAQAERAASSTPLTPSTRAQLDGGEL